MLMSSWSFRTPEAKTLRVCLFVMISPSIYAEVGKNSIHALETITVTAQKRVESLYEVPISVSVVPGKKIQNLTLRNLEDVAAYVPNLNVSQGQVFSRLFIRGIGSGLNLGFEQSVGTFVDGIYAGRDRQSRIPLLDVERVEVLKGPQGILFGKNTTAGAINIVTARPSPEFGSRLSTFYAPDHGEAFAEGAITGSLADGLSGRIAARISHLDGYLTNTALDRREPEKDEQVIRGSLRWEGSDDLEVNAKYEYGHFKLQGLTSQIVETGSFGRVFSALDPEFDSVFNTTRSAGLGAPLFGPDSSDTRYHTAGLFIDSWVGEHRLTGTTGYQEYQYDDLTDLDLSALSVLGFQVGEQFRQISQEVRLDSPEATTSSWQPWNLDALEYLIGAYYQYQDLEINTSGNVSSRQLSAFRIPLPGLGIPPPAEFSRVNRSDQTSHSWSAFGRLTWLPADDWRVLAGLRFTHESKQAAKNLFIANAGTRTPNPRLARFAALAINAFPHHFEGSRDENHLMPMAGLQWDVSEHHMVYFNFSTSAKGGGFDDLAVSGVQANWEFADEFALSYELGAKTLWLDDTVSLNLALFRSDFNNFQVSQFDGRANFVVGNAASVISQGIELDGRWLITEDLTLSAAVAVLDARYASFPDAGCTAAQAFASGNFNTCRQDLSGRPTPYAPDWSGNVYLDYRFPLRRLNLEPAWLNDLAVTTQFNLNFSDSYFLAEDLDPLLVQNAYATLDVRFALGDLKRHWEVAFVGKNLTDQLLSLDGNDIPILAGALRKSTARPRSVGIQLVLAY